MYIWPTTKTIKLLHYFFKKNSKKFVSIRFYAYLCHIYYNFEYIFVFCTKTSKKTYMTESLARKYCSETYK